MSDENQPIPGSPIIEAVVDIDCDLPPGCNLQSLREAATDALRDRYPKFRQQWIQKHAVTAGADAPVELRSSQGPGAMQFLTADEKQLVQFRPNGFSFNRLAPYNSLDEYLADIQAGWETFLRLAQPVLIRKIGIRMINRIPLPMDGGRLNFGEFLRVAPRLPETGSPLAFLGFLEQQMALDVETGSRANIIKTTELPQNDLLPLILDIEVFHPCELPPADWDGIQDGLDSLRSLKNRIFRNTLTARCLNLFSPQA